MHAEGRGGLARNEAEGVRLFRLSVLRDNPLGQLYLAQALEKGHGVPADRAAALELYRKSATQEGDGQARAQEAVTRLGSAASR